MMILAMYLHLYQYEDHVLGPLHGLKQSNRMAQQLPILFTHILSPMI